MFMLVELRNHYLKTVRLEATFSARHWTRALSANERIFNKIPVCIMEWLATANISARGTSVLLSKLSIWYVLPNLSFVRSPSIDLSRVILILQWMNEQSSD